MLHGRDQFVGRQSDGRHWQDRHYSTNSEDHGRYHTAFVTTATYSNSTNRVITNSAQWMSSDDRIAAVSAVGLATGVSSGKVTITATSGTVSGSTVYDGTPGVGTVS